VSRPGEGGADSREAVLPLVPGLRVYARALAGGDAHAADDLVQDTLLLAFRAWDRFVPGTNLKAWLVRILRNRFLSSRARKHVAAEIGTDDLGALAWVRPEQEARLEVRAFRRAFAGLSPKYREVLVLQAVHGMSLEEIAAACGCKVGTVKSRMNRARAALKATLLGEDVGPPGASSAADPWTPPAPPRPGQRPRAA
jgi:RNA polymerase sigma-70 factor, ECF subfamily